MVRIGWEVKKDHLTNGLKEFRLYSGDNEGY